MKVDMTAEDAALLPWARSESEYLDTPSGMATTFNTNQQQHQQDQYQQFLLFQQFQQFQRFHESQKSRQQDQSGLPMEQHEHPMEQPEHRMEQQVYPMEQQESGIVQQQEEVAALRSDPSQPLESASSREVVGAPVAPDEEMVEIARSQGTQEDNHDISCQQSQSDKPAEQSGHCEEAKDISMEDQQDDETLESHREQHKQDTKPMTEGIEQAQPEGLCNPEQAHQAQPDLQIQEQHATDVQDMDGVEEQPEPRDEQTQEQSPDLVLDQEPQLAKNEDVAVQDETAIIVEDQEPKAKTWASFMDVEFPADSESESEDDEWDVTDSKEASKVKDDPEYVPDDSEPMDRGYEPTAKEDYYEFYRFPGVPSEFTPTCQADLTEDDSDLEDAEAMKYYMRQKMKAGVRCLSKLSALDIADLSILEIYQLIGLSGRAIPFEPRLEDEGDIELLATEGQLHETMVSHWASKIFAALKAIDGDRFVLRSGRCESCHNRGIEICFKELSNGDACCVACSIEEEVSKPEDGEEQASPGESTTTLDASVEAKQNDECALQVIV